MRTLSVLYNQADLQLSGTSGAIPRPGGPEPLQNTVFGEAWAFYHVKFPPSPSDGGQPAPRAIVLYTPLEQVEQVFHIPAGHFSQDPTPRAMNLSHIRDITGIFTGPKSGKAYILRKHPALEALSFVSREVDRTISGDDVSAGGNTTTARPLSDADEEHVVC